MRIIQIQKKEQIALALTLLAGAVLRFYNLGFQSFWLDELHTVIEANPGQDQLFHYLRCCDQHPPFYFMFENIWFYVFGTSEFWARFPSAIAGIISIWAIYLLGKEFFSRQAGLIAAILTAFNYFNIYYSQEARPYIFLFLFACFSFLFMLRMFKSLSKWDLIGYIVFTSLMLYTHYYGFFAFASQLVAGAFYLLFYTENRKRFLRIAIIAVILTVLSYAPWIPFLLSMEKIKSFWISPVSGDFAIDYFFKFFGDSALLNPFIVLFFILGILFLFFEQKDSGRGLREKSFAILFIWIFITYLIPWLRSVLVVPMLHPRYAIVVLPAFLVLMSHGLQRIPGRGIKVVIISAFCILSLADLILVKEYYNSVHKTQYREMAEFITRSAPQNKIFTRKDPWHLRYYLKDEEENRILSIEGNQGPRLQKKGNEGFWLVDAHITDTSRPLLLKDTGHYSLRKIKKFYDSWAALYLPRNREEKTGKLLLPNNFPPSNRFLLNEDSVVALWNGEVKSSPIGFETGTFTLNILMQGTPVDSIFPEVEIHLGDKVIGTVIPSMEFKNTTLTFILEEPAIIPLQFILLNDEENLLKNEDRNVFIKQIVIKKAG